jgi:hypothetical protein
VLRLEWDHVDDEIEAVRDGECAVGVAVERDVREIGRAALGLSGERQLPVVADERTCDRRADVPGSAEDECSPCDRSTLLIGERGAEPAAAGGFDGHDVAV